MSTVSTTITADADKLKLVADALKQVGQTLDWTAHGQCRSFGDGPILSTSDAVEVAKAGLALIESIISGDPASATESGMPAITLEGLARINSALKVSTNGDSVVHRCPEVSVWKKTGKLPASAHHLEDYAKEHWADTNDPLQMAESDTVRQALRILGAAACN